MSPVEHLGEDFLPEPIVRVRTGASTPSGRSLGRFRRTSSTPAAAVGVALTITAVAYWVPEFRVAEFAPALLQQVRPLVAIDLVTLGRDPAPLQAGGGTWGQAVLLVGAVLLSIAAHGGSGARRIVWPAAVVVAVGAVWSIVTAWGEGPVGRPFVGIIALALAAVYAIAAAVADRRLGDRPRASGEWGTAAFWSYVVVLPVPFAVGRAVAGHGVRDRALEIVASGSAFDLLTLLTWATPLCLLVGVVVGVVGRSAFGALPPWDGVSAPVTSLVTTGALAALLVTVLVPMARDASADAVSVSRAATPSFGRAVCGVWHDEAVPSRSAVLSEDCTTLEVYDGLELVGRSDLAFASPATTGVTTPEAEPVTARPVAAVYDGVLVLAGIDPAGAAAGGAGPIDLVAGLSRADASTVWTFRCPDSGSLTIRFAGSRDEDPAGGAITRDGDPTAVLVGCSDGVRRLDPLTGAGF